MMVGVYTFGLFEMSLAMKRRMFWCVRLLLSFLCSAAIQEGISSGVVPWRRQTDRQTDIYAHTCCVAVSTPPLTEVVMRSKLATE